MKAKLAAPRRGFWIALAALAAGTTLPFALAESTIERTAAGRCTASLEEIAPRDVALVLGTSPHVGGGGDNPYFTARIDAAAQLWHAGKARYLLVSGDNRTRVYDEPTAMRRELRARGVPKDAIVCDYAGLRTLDSVVRARKVFGQSQLTIVSQGDHNRRALFLARAAGIDAQGFDAADPGANTALWWRERLARVTALLDTYVWHRQPRHLGPRITIGAIPPPRNSTWQRSD